MDSLLSGAIDTHVHTAPDLIERNQSDVGLARDALDAGMGGVVVKNHALPTVGRVTLANNIVGKEILYGGLTLNGSVGGINPTAVETALKLGAKIIWLPTLWSAHHARQARSEGISEFVGQPLPTFDEELTVISDGELTDVAFNVIELIVEYDATLGTGHISPVEIEAIVTACVNMGAQVLVNHPFFRVTDLSIEKQAELAEMGALMEYCAYCLQNTPGHSVNRIARAIDRIGPKSCILATDFGQRENNPVSGFGDFVRQMQEVGVSTDTVRTLIVETPAQVLDTSA